MSQEPYYRQLASDEWSRAKRKATVRQLLDKIRFNRQALVPFDEVRKRLRLRHYSYRGVQQIPLDQIVGSVNRYNDFTNTFLPRSEALRDRWQRISSLMSSTGTPPVELYKVGNAYFVLDGNHRVSVARAHGAETIEAEVCEYPTPSAGSDEVMLDDALLEAERQDFLEHTKLDELRPGHGIRFSVPGRYIELESQIAQFQECTEKIEGEPCSLRNAVADWYDRVYEPTIDIIRHENILRHFPGRTEADLFAWALRHRRSLSSKYSLSLGVQAVARRMVGRGPLVWLRRLLAKREV